MVVAMVGDGGSDGGVSVVVVVIVVVVAVALVVGVLLSLFFCCWSWLSLLSVYSVHGCAVEGVETCLKV